MSPESASAKATHRASSMAKGTSLLKRVAILALRTFSRTLRNKFQGIDSVSGLVSKSLHTV